MNTAQRDIATAVGAHFKRQWLQMPRNGPVDRIAADQSTLVQTLQGIFLKQQSSFDCTAFYEAIEVAE